MQNPRNKTDFFLVSGVLSIVYWTERDEPRPNMGDGLIFIIIVQERENLYLIPGIVLYSHVYVGWVCVGVCMCTYVFYHFQTLVLGIWLNLFTPTKINKY